MFQDGRSRRVVLLSHCLLNQNAISDGTAVCPAAFRALVQALLERDIGILQMPCPELCCLGLDRGNPAGAERPAVEENTRIRAALGRDPAGLTALAEQVAGQVREYRRHGFDVLGLIGANRSPCCGVDTTSEENREVPGQGLFVQMILRRLAEAGIRLPAAGLKSPEDVPEVLRRLAL